MSSKVYRYTFSSKAPMQEIEETLHLAVLAAENLHGQSEVRLDASYFFDKEKGACVIDASTDVGGDIVRLFTGFLIQSFGEGGFKVKGIDGVPAGSRKEG